MFSCDLILVFHYLLIVGNLVDLLFLCPLLDCFAISVIFRILRFFDVYFIQYIHDSLVLIFSYALFFKICAMDKLISELFCSIIFVANYGYYYVELLWVDYVVQMSGWIEICSPFVLFFWEKLLC
ncbi:hypothetical protein AMTRI_Chr13g123870 [Amborella trichopoda]